MAKSASQVAARAKSQPAKNTKAITQRAASGGGGGGGAVTGMGGGKYAGTSGIGMPKRKPGQSKADQAAQVASTLGLPPGVMQYVKNPTKFMKNVLAGKGPAYTKLAMLKSATSQLGYNQDQAKMQGYVGQQYDPTTGQPIVNYHTNVTPQGTQWAATVGEHLDPTTGQVQGMTPGEKASYYAEMATPVKSQAQQEYSNEAEREAAAGIDPRSGVAAGNAQAIGAKTAGALAEAGRQTSLEDIQRQKDWETYAGNLSQLQEQQRQSEQGADITKGGQIQTGLTDLANLGENQRQFDVTYTEGQRQAQQQRADMQKAAAAAAPSTFEKVSAGISGFVGGLGA